MTSSQVRGSALAKAAIWPATAFGLLYLAIALPVVALPSPITASGLFATGVLGVALVVLSAIDYVSFRLPDAITLPMIAAGLALAALLEWQPAVEWRLAATAAGYAIVYALDWVYLKVRGRQGIGLGDAKLLAVAGAWLGPDGLAPTLLYACCGALIFVAIRTIAHKPMSAREALPFGPFLAIAIWLVWIYGLTI
jgi:leader peptidase (prepilin peptidase) / N-methyltransferase